MTIQLTTRFAMQRTGGNKSPHVGECIPALATHEQDDCGRVSAAGER